jgi:hypothetical protein
MPRFTVDRRMRAGPNCDARILLFSERALERPKWQVGQYEFEDVIDAIDDVDLVAPGPASRPLALSLAQRAVRRAGRPDWSAIHQMERTRVAGRYDLFFAFFHYVPDIPHLRRLEGWRERCVKAVCVLAEVWSHEVRRYRRCFELLRRLEFDRVYVVNARPAGEIASILGCPVEPFPYGVDALRFSPYPDPPQRCIDLYQFGRRSEITHRAALEMARRGEVFYVYDSLGNVSDVPDPQAHRELIAAHVKRSRYFFAYEPALGNPRARGEPILAPRYFEGIAGGAVLLGNAPDLPAYREAFPWPDATITIPYAAGDLSDIVAELDAQPERLARARRNNVVGTLRRHDWAYRWRRILETAGLEPTQRLTARVARLEAIADQAEADATAWTSA